MTEKDLNKKLTGEYEPKFLTVREKTIISKVCSDITKLEAERDRLLAECEAAKGLIDALYHKIPSEVEAYLMRYKKAREERLGGK